MIMMMSWWRHWRIGEVRIGRFHLTIARLWTPHLFYNNPVESLLIAMSCLLIATPCLLIATSCLLIATPINESINQWINESYSWWRATCHIKGNELLAQHSLWLGHKWKFIEVRFKAAFVGYHNLYPPPSINSSQPESRHCRHLSLELTPFCSDIHTCLSSHTCCRLLKTHCLDDAFSSLTTAHTIK